MAIVSVTDRRKRRRNLPSAWGSIRPAGPTRDSFAWVYDKAVVIRRWEFEYDLQLGPDWVIPISSFQLPAERRPFAFDNRAKALPPPEFATGAEVAVAKPVRGKDRAGERHLMTAVSFPPALPTAATPHADDYEVTLELRQGEVVRTVCQKRVYSPRYLYGEKMDTEMVVCHFADTEIPVGWDLRYVVRPVNAFGGKGSPISTPWEMSKA